MKQKIISILFVASMTLLLLLAQAQALAADAAGAAEDADTASRSYAADAEEDILTPEPVSAREAEQFDPAETLMRLEPEPDGIFQNGAFTGRQTISDVPVLLDDRTQILYNRILNGLENRESSVDLLDFWTTDMDWVQNTFQTVVNDHPELFYANWFAVWGFPDHYTSMELTYYDLTYYGYSDIEQAIEVFNAAVDRALAVVDSGMSDPEKALALHDYLVLNCGYNWDVAVTSDFSQYWADTPNKMLATAFGALVNGDPICQSYSLAYKLLLNRAGIDSILIGSSQMGHVWNGVYINGQWYQTDVTWDDPVPNIEGGCSYNNFLLSDDTFGDEKHGHHDWEQKVSCTDDTFESGWIFNISRHAVYRWNGCYYYTQNNGNQLISILSSPTLSLEDGTVLCENTGSYYYLNQIWHDGCAYSITRELGNDLDNWLMRYDLDSEKVTRIGSFRFERAPSPDGYYQEDLDAIGLSYTGAAGGTISVFSSTRREVQERCTIPSEISAWENMVTGSAGIAGLSVAPDLLTAGILWGENAPDESLTFAAAFYQSGRLLTVRLCTVPVVYGWAEEPSLRLVRLDGSGLPRYDEVRLMLYTDAGLRPVCGAWKAESE